MEESVRPFAPPRPAASEEAVRLCPRCETAGPIAPGHAIWPPDWSCPACGAEVGTSEGIPVLAPELEATVSFDPRDFALLEKAEADHFWFVARRRLILELAKRFAPDAKSFLEVGCGGGNVIAAMAKSRPWSRVVGVEAHIAGLRLARSRLPNEVELLQCDARRLPFRRAFDLIGSFDVLEHIADDEAAIAAATAALTPAGVFIAAVPQHPALWSSADEIAHHIRRYRRGELERKFRTAGLEILFSSSFNSLLLPLMALSRYTARRKRSDRDARQQAKVEFETSPTLNRVLLAILTGETFLTRSGLRWPIGGSRIVVGRKRSSQRG